jgi:hypothetical protein
VNDVVKWYRATMRVSPDSASSFDVYVCKLDEQHMLQVDARCTWGTRWRRDMLRSMVQGYVEVTDASVLRALDKILEDHRR